MTAYRGAFEILTREGMPRDWAATQNNLCTLLVGLGERENGTARLEQAVGACRAALEVRTRQHLPVDWAATQSNLGNALLILGKRRHERGTLEQAVGEGGNDFG